MFASFCLRQHQCKYNSLLDERQKRKKQVSGSLFAIFRRSFYLLCCTLSHIYFACMHTYTTVTSFPASSGMLFIWAMKTDATVTKRAVPSMLTVAPIGSTNLEIRGSILLFSCMQRNVTGSAAALQQFNFHQQSLFPKSQGQSVY